MAVFHPGGLATGIGSLPFTHADTSVKFVRNYLTEVPHWPQMPNLGIREHFNSQFLNVLVDLELMVSDNTAYIFDTSRANWPDLLTGFYTTALAAQEGDAAALAYFAPPRKSASGLYALVDDIRNKGNQGIHYVKGQVVGPLTVGFQLKNHKGNYAYYQEELRELIVTCLALSARYQARLLAGLGLPAIIFVDEPGVAAYGSRHHLTLSREMIIQDLNALAAAIHSEGALAGVHSCEAVDWTLLLDSDIDILSLDAYRYGPSLLYYPAKVSAFIRNGGVVAWGVVPTLDDPFLEDEETLLKKLVKLFKALLPWGVTPEQLLDQCMITPACGTGLLPVKQVERIYSLTCRLSQNLMHMGLAAFS